MEKKLINEKEARAKLGGICRSTFWELETSDPKFPRSVKISPRRKGYFAHQIDEYLELLAKRSRMEAAQ